MLSAKDFLRRLLALSAAVLASAALSQCGTRSAIGIKPSADAGSDLAGSGGAAGGAGGPGSGGTNSVGDDQDTASAGSPGASGGVALGGSTGTDGAANDGGAGAIGSAGAPGSGGSREASPPSCAKPDGGTLLCNGESCCTSPLVAGGTFYRGYDGVSDGYKDKSYPATVSDFRLDKYEITVGRFRNFVAAYPGNKPKGGQGKNPNDATDPGWNDAWNTGALPKDQAALIAAVKWGLQGGTWTDSPGENEANAMNCLDWYVAFAFCIWDGGRLPTEAEWNYAAAGGSEQRVYPWSSPPTSTTSDDSYAVYQPGASARVWNVGSKSTKGDGKYGQTDLAGNLWEWVLDWYGTYPTPCLNCANLSSPIYRPGTDSGNRVLRGGAFDVSPSSYLIAAFRLDFGSSYNAPTFGARCARTP